MLDLHEEARGRDVDGLTALDLIVNGVAINRTSLGARRYYDGIMAQLHWPGTVSVTELPARRSIERLSELSQRGRRDAIFWSPSHRGPLRAHNHVFTVLDCINVEYTYKSDWRLPAFRSFMNLTLAGATCVVAISRATRDAILENYKVDERKVIAIPGPIEFGNRIGGMKSAANETVRSDRPFVLMVTNTLPHKNTALSLMAFAASNAARAGIALKIVGSADVEGLRACQARGIQVDIHRGVPDETLAAWLSEALFLFSPSLQEGLNLPVAEALSVGANVLCSDIPVHREFYEGRAAMCNPRELDAMVEGLNAAFDRRGQWENPENRRPGPSFKEVAAAYRELFLKISATRTAARPLSTH